MIHPFAAFALWRKKCKSHDSSFCGFCPLAQKVQIPRFILLRLLPFGAKSANPTIHPFAAFALWRKECKSHDSSFCGFCPLAQKVQIPRFILLRLLPFGAKSANPTIHPFAAFALWRKKCKSHDSSFCGFCPLVQKVQIPRFILLWFLPLSAKSANPMIHPFAAFALWRKKCKSHDSSFCGFCPLAQKVQIP